MFRTPLTALLLVSGLALAEHPLLNHRVFVSLEGFRAVVASVKGTANGCVLQVTGPGGELDGLVLDCTTVSRDTTTRYSTSIQGRERLIFKTDGQGAAGLAESTGLLSYSEAETRKEDLAALWARHQAQIASGQLAAISKFDRVAEVAALTKTIDAAAEPVTRACGSKMKVTLDWALASDEVFKQARPANGCLKVLELMEQMCSRWKIVRTTFSERFGSFRCIYGSDQATFSLEGTSLTMSSSQDTVNLPGGFDHWVRDAL